MPFAKHGISAAIHSRCRSALPRGIGLPASPLYLAGAFRQRPKHLCTVLEETGDESLIDCWSNVSNAFQQRFIVNSLYASIDYASDGESPALVPAATQPKLLVLDPARHFGKTHSWHNLGWTRKP